MSTVTPGSAQVPQQQGRPDHDQMPPSAPAGERRTGTRAVQDAVHVVLCVLAGILIAVGFALDPSRDADNGTELMDVVVQDPGRFFWASAISAFGLVFIAAVGLAVLRVVQGRGRVAATVGGLLLVLGGIAAGAGQFMYGAVVTVMAESGEDLAVMAAVQDSAEDSLRAGMPFFIGFPAIMLGLLVTSFAIFRSGAMPRWIPAVLVAGVVAVFVLGDSDASSIADVLLGAGCAGIAWVLWRRTAGLRSR